MKHTLLILAGLQQPIAVFCLALAGGPALRAAETSEAARIAADPSFTRIANYGDLQVWRKSLPDGSHLVALGNKDRQALREVSVYWTDLGLPQYAQALVTDATGSKTLGRYATDYTVSVKPQDVVTVRIVPEKPSFSVADRQPTAKVIAAKSTKPLNSRRLKLTGSASSGAFVERGYAGRPDNGGVLERYAIDLPAYSAGCYFGDNFPIMGNTTGPRTFADSMAGLSYGGLFVLLKLKDGGYLALVPVSGPLAFAWLEPAAGGLLLDVGTRGTAEVCGNLPLLAWACAADPYAACTQAWQAASVIEEIRGNFALREDKKLPEYFHYLGWCSWEQFRKNINEAVLDKAFADIQMSGLPVRWALIDDGHVSNRDEQFTSFKPNENFPRGFAPLLARGRQKGIRWFGLWQYMSGYGSLIAPHNDLGLEKHLQDIYFRRSQKVVRGMMPKGDRASAEAFYSRLMGPAKGAGFDFVKIDFQGYHFNNYTGTENPVATVQSHYQTMEQLCHDSGIGLLNCLSMNHIRVFNTRFSAVMRASRDYRKDADAWNKEQTRRAFHNALWLGQTMWLDHDMTHSSDQVAGRLLSISKALSGGPVYLSDDPKLFYAPNIRPLAFDSGELLRPLAPAAPLPASIFSDPLNQNIAYEVIAPLAGQAAAIGIYNLTVSGTPVEARIRAVDYRTASAMIQPYPGPWPLPAEGLLLYDWATGQACRLGDEYHVALPDYSVRLLLLCPIQNGWAVVGRTDKYLSPAGVEVVACDARTLTLRLKESGPLAVWSERGKVQSEDAQFTDAGGGLWRSAYARGQDRLIRIRRP